MKQDLLSFRFASRGIIASNLLGEVVNKLNSTTWMGRAPRTCRVVKLHVEGTPGGPAVGYVIIRHRPNGWKVRRPMRDEHGRYVDPDGIPLREDQEPIISEIDPLDEIDFNEFQFGIRVDRPHIPE